MSVDQDVSPERNQAHHKLYQAQLEEHKGHVEKALALAREGLHQDPTCTELRHWIAETYVKHGEPRKASTEYQELIHQNRDDQKAWDMLRQIDSAAAERLDRLAHLAPDPFVAKHNLKAGAAAEDLVLEDVEGLGAGDEGLSGGGVPYVHQETSENLASLEEVEGEFEPLIDDAVVHSAGGGDDVFEDMSDAGVSDEPQVTRDAADNAFFGAGEDALVDIIEGEHEPESGAVVTAAATTAQPEPDPPPPPAEETFPWEHEQDRPFRDKLMHYPAFEYMVGRITQAWEEEEWEAVHGTCAHADAKQHPDIFGAAHKAAVRLALSKPELFIIPERFTQPEVFRGRPLQIAVPTGILRGFTNEEKTFIMGRWLGAVASGHLGYLQACHVVIDRKVRIEDCAMAIRSRLEGITRGWQDRVEKDQVPKLKALCHAWEQRAVLSSDRAGLMCCQDIDVAASAIAKSTVKYADDAMKLRVETFMSEFEGRDIGALAAIPVEDGPCTSKPYAVYRIAMLRWWASTPEGQALI